MESVISISVHHDITMDDAFKLTEIFSDRTPVVFYCIKDRVDLNNLSSAQLKKLTRLNQSYQLPSTNAEEIINNINDVFEYQRLKPC